MFSGVVTSVVGHFRETTAESDIKLAATSVIPFSQSLMLVVNIIIALFFQCLNFSQCFVSSGEQPAKKSLIEEEYLDPHIWQ